MRKGLRVALEADQRRALENVRAVAARIWAHPLHRTCADHGVSHSERVIALLGGLTAGMMATDKRLSAAEVWVLLAAAYLHNIGMQHNTFAESSFEEVRLEYGERTAEMIFAVFKDPKEAFPISLADDPAICEAVALVARGQGQVNLLSDEYDDLVSGGGNLRLRLLAALLRFADALDIDHRRVDLERMKLVTLPAESRLRWWKCHYVGGVRIDDNEYIRIQYRFPSEKAADYERLIVPLVEADIRGLLASLEEVFRTGGIKVALGPSQTRALRLVEPIPPQVEALAAKRTEPDLHVEPAFWEHFAVVISFGKVVHKAFQAIDFSHGPRLLERAENIARYPMDATLLVGFNKGWEDFYQYFQAFTVREMFEPPERTRAWLKRVDASFQHLRGRAVRMGRDVEASAKAVADASGYYQEIKALMLSYPERVADIADVVGRQKAGSASRWDRGRLRKMLVAKFEEEELRRLCAKTAGVAYKDLPGEERAAKARSLVAHFDRREQLRHLVDACRDLRPDVAWVEQLDVPYPTQLANKTRELIQTTRSLAVQADSLIQNLIDVIVPKGGRHERRSDD
jgi:hypothetical protein